MRLLLLLLAISAALVAGCGGDDDETTTTPAETAPAETTPAESSGEEGGGDVVNIMMKDIQFDPQSVTVSVGQTVRWTNEDDVQHDADAVNGEFESDLYGKGGTQEWKPEEPGTVEYVCSVHPNMQGTITVE